MSIEFVRYRYVIGNNLSGESQDAQTEGQPLRTDVGTAMVYQGRTGKVFEHGAASKRKKSLRARINKIGLDPKRPETEVSYRIPERS